MNLTNKLTAANLSKSKLAELLGVSRQTVQRMGEKVSDEVLAIIKDYVPRVGERVKEPSGYSDAELVALFKRRGGYEAETNPPKLGQTSTSWGRETDHEIAQSLGIRVWEFNQMIADYCKRNPYV